MIAGSLSSCIAGFLLSCRFSQSSGPRHSCVGTGPAFAATGVGSRAHFGRATADDVDPDEVSAVEPDNDEGIEQVETDSWNNEQVHGGDTSKASQTSNKRSMFERKLKGRAA
jgi:hypothetical protein